jgi:cytochrome c oxidase subunit II
MAIYAGVVLVVVVALWVHAIHRHHDDVDNERIKQIHRRWIVSGGVALPLFSITLLLMFGIPAGHQMLPLPPEEGEAFRVEVTGHQWWWDVRYPDSLIALVNEVHIPAGVPVDVYLHSADVIHSFWVPRLGGKTDMIPGHTNVLRLQADEPGTYRGQCAEFCGRDHAHMKFVVHAHAEQDFDAWWRDAHEELDVKDE